MKAATESDFRMLERERIAVRTQARNSAKPGSEVLYPNIPPKGADERGQVRSQCGHISARSWTGSPALNGQCEGLSVLQTHCLDEKQA